MIVFPKDVLCMTDEYVIVEPNGDMVLNEDIVWMISDEEDRKLYDEWFN